MSDKKYIKSLEEENERLKTMIVHKDEQSQILVSENEKLKEKSRYDEEEIRRMRRLIREYGIEDGKDGRYSNYYDRYGYASGRDAYAEEIRRKQMEEDIMRKMMESPPTFDPIMYSPKLKKSKNKEDWDFI
jgi:hypothetical protein